MVGDQSGNEDVPAADDCEDCGNEGLPGRRRYLKSVGAVAAAFAGGAASTGVGAAEYRTITVSSGSKWTYSLSDGETFSNVLIDITASGASMNISASGSNWAVRNVGVRGAQEVGTMLNARGDGVIDTVYFGEGVDSQPGAVSERTRAILVDNEHSGFIEVKNCFVQGHSDNGIYSAGYGRLVGPGQTDGGGGNVHFSNCYLRDNNISHFRVAAPGDVIENCVVENTGNVPGNHDGIVNSRGVYTGYGDPEQVIDIRNCDFLLTDENTNWGVWNERNDYPPGNACFVSGDHDTYGACSTLRVSDTQFRDGVSGQYVTLNNTGSNPDTAVPSGVPTSPEEAASGGGTGNSDSLPRLVTIDGVGELANYEFTVDGDLEKSTENGASIDSGDEIDGSTATGAVYGGADSYRFSGEFTAFSLDGNATVIVDGQEVDPTLLDLHHTIDISGPSGSVVNYEFTVSDELAGVDINDEDSVDGTTATGAVAGGTDSYQYAGDITDFSADGDLTVRVDGTEVDQALLGLSRTVEITGGSSSGVVGYEFTVTDELAGVDINDEDSVDGTTATGAVAGGTDSYRFDGEIVTFSLDGDATVLVDGEEADPALFLPNRLVFEGNGGGGSTYEFAVSGELVGDPELGALESDDTIDGSAASGAVTDDRDGYRFSGDLVSLRTDGTVDVVFEDTDG